MNPGKGFEPGSATSGFHHFLAAILADRASLLHRCQVEKNRKISNEEPFRLFRELSFRSSLQFIHFFVFNLVIFGPKKFPKTQKCSRFQDFFFCSSVARPGNFFHPIGHDVAKKRSSFPLFRLLLDFFWCRSRVTENVRVTERQRNSFPKNFSFPQFPLDLIFSPGLFKIRCRRLRRRRWVQFLLLSVVLLLLLPLVLCCFCLDQNLKRKKKVVFTKSHSVDSLEISTCFAVVDHILSTDGNKCQLIFVDHESCCH